MYYLSCQALEYWDDFTLGGKMCPTIAKSLKKISEKGFLKESCSFKYKILKLILRCVLEAIDVNDRYKFSSFRLNLFNLRVIKFQK